MGNSSGCERHTNPEWWLDKGNPLNHVMQELITLTAADQKNNLKPTDGSTSNSLVKTGVPTCCQTPGSMHSCHTSLLEYK